MVTVMAAVVVKRVLSPATLSAMLTGSMSATSSLSIAVMVAVAVPPSSLIVSCVERRLRNCLPDSSIVRVMVMGFAGPLNTLNNARVVVSLSLSVS